nr:MAG TPA: hypothetical protein [Caudoviricetes sp.]
MFRRNCLTDGSCPGKPPPMIGWRNVYCSAHPPRNLSRQFSAFPPEHHLRGEKRSVSICGRPENG